MQETADLIRLYLKQVAICDVFASSHLLFRAGGLGLG